MMISRTLENLFWDLYEKHNAFETSLPVMIMTHVFAFSTFVWIIKKKWDKHYQWWVTKKIDLEKKSILGCIEEVTKFKKKEMKIVKIKELVEETKATIRKSKDLKNDFRLVTMDDLEMYYDLINEGYGSSESTYGKFKSSIKEKQRISIKEAEKKIKNHVVLFFTPSEFKNNVVGSYCFQFHQNNNVVGLELSTFCILKEFRKKGLAKKYIKETDTFKKLLKGKIDFFFCTALKNTFLVSFYARVMNLEVLKNCVFKYPSFSKNTEYLCLYSNVNE